MGVMKVVVCVVVDSVVSIVRQGNTGGMQSLVWPRVISIHRCMCGGGGIVVGCVSVVQVVGCGLCFSCC